MLCFINKYCVSFHTLHHFLGPRLARRGLRVSRLTSTRPGRIRPAGRDKFHVLQNGCGQCDGSLLAQLELGSERHVPAIIFDSPQKLKPNHVGQAVLLDVVDKIVDEVVVDRTTLEDRHWAFGELVRKQTFLLGVELEGDPMDVVQVKRVELNRLHPFARHGFKRCLELARVNDFSKDRLDQFGRHGVDVYLELDLPSRSVLMLVE